ncbi:unnamed protein product [Symbiodinium sp. CCMP2592]|nr:unnamed protein product [Symbiodinium sp. CCMP2592]
MLQCDKSHEHKKWGRLRDQSGRGMHYATAEETACPAGLCTAAAREISLALQDKGIMLDARASSDTALASSFAQRQPRRGRGTVGPPEYKRTVLVRLPLDFQPPEHVPEQPEAPLRDIPAGSKLLWTPVFVDGGAEVREAQFGVYHTPDEFLHAALKVTHPFDSAVSIDGPNLRAIAFALEHGVKAVQQKRMEVLDHYRALERSLRADEAALKQAMDPTAREIMGSKKLLLFKQMLKDAGVPDERLFEDMVQGFRLTGPLEPSGLFPLSISLPSSPWMNCRTSQWSKHLVEAACRKASQDPEVARAVWEESLGQVEKGWLSGPFTWDQMDQKYGGTWVASKRFGVSQGDKVRAVDDLSQFQVNASVTETEKIQLEGLDDIVALARFHLGATVAGTKVTKVFRLPLSGGGVYQGRLHPDFREGRARRLNGRALDLRSAYKQLARHPADDWASVLGVLDPDTNTVAYFENYALPFGASSAVTGFNRAARALRIIMSRLLFLVNTSFFDDFCQLEIEGLTDSADQAALEMLDLLGWEVSDGEKLKPFASEFTMLGAVLSFKDAGRGLIRVRNKAGRLEEISDMVDRLASDPTCGARSLPSLKGKLLFVATQLIHHAERQQGPDLQSRVLVNLWSEQPPVVIFTDGACEETGNQVTHGAVIIDPASQTREVFGGHIPANLVEKWRSSGRTQLIFFAELYPVLIARRSDLPDSPDWGDSDAELDAELAGEQGFVWPGDDCPEPPDRGDGESDGEAASSLSMMGAGIGSSGYSGVSALGSSRDLDSVDVDADGQSGTCTTNMGLAFVHAFSRLSQPSASPSLLLPWETPLMKTIFEPLSEPLPELKKPSLGLADLSPPEFAKYLPDASSSASAAKPVHPSLDFKAGHAAEQAIRMLDDDDFEKKQIKLMNARIAKWHVIGLRYSDVFELPRPSDEEISAMMGTRSVRTVLARAGSMLQFVRWCDTVRGSSDSMFTDEAYWGYLQFLKTSRASASRGSSFLCAVRFAWHVMDLTKICGSPSRRCVGLAEQMSAERGTLRQSAPLLVQQVLQLHHMLHSGLVSKLDKAFVAYILICLCARCRQSDLAKVSYVEVDISDSGLEGYVIFYTRQHKTARAARRLSQMLPILMPVCGIDDQEWFLTARRAMEGRLARRGITSEEVSAFLKLVVPSHDGVSRIASQSLKRTMLAWSSKAGLSSESRAILGRHAKSVESSEAIYSVELGLPAVKQLEGILRQVRDKEFRPDASRADMWRFPPSPPATVAGAKVSKPLIPSVEVKSESEASDSESSSSEESSGGHSDSSDSSSGSPPAPKRRPQAESQRLILSEKGGEWVVHKRSHVWHWTYGVNMLMCGRKRSHMYVLSDKGEPSGPEDSDLSHMVTDRARAQDQGVKFSEVAFKSLKFQGFVTLGQLAYSVGQPGQIIPDEAFNQFVKDTIPRASGADSACLRRLIFEAQTLVLADLRQQINDPDGSSKKVPEAEREQRLASLRKQLPGLLIEGPTEPGRALLDECASQESACQLKYISPDRCISRTFEVTNHKKTPRQLELDANHLVVKNQEDELTMPSHSALQVQEAFLRRGLAYVFSQSVSFDAYSRYLSKLFSHIHREPPPNHARTSVAQLVEADKLVWTTLIERGVKPRKDATGAFPLDSELMQALESYEVSFGLMPLRSGSKWEPRKRFKGAGKDGKDDNKAPGKGDQLCFSYNLQGDKCKCAVTCDAETFAARLLKQAGAFYAGMYRKGNGISGLRKSCREFPLSVAAINAFMAHAVPTASYNAFAILDNVASPAHRDLQNEPVASHVLALSAFAGGGIWVQCPRGAVCRRVAGVNTPGKVLSLDKGPVQLDAASSLHSTEPWQGDRVILSCYTLKGYDLLTSDQCNSLLQLSFPLPLQVGQCARPSPVDYAALRAATGIQPKASKTVPLVPEHRAVIVVRGPAQLLQPPCVLRQRLEADWAVPTSCTCAWPSIPKYSQLLRSDLLDVEVKEGSSGKVLELAWGIPFSPSEFVDCAVAAGHPSLLEANLPQELQDAITVRPILAVLAPKRLLLFKSLLQEYGYPDLDAFNELVSGVSLTGDAPHAGIFNAAERHASMTEAELKAKAKVIQQDVLGKVTSQGSEIDAIVKQKTVEEVQKGWLVGPFEIEDLPEHAIISKRFGLPQVFGRLAKVCLKHLTDFAYGDLPPNVMRQEPMFVFTDACFEPSASDWKCGIGGVLFNHRGSTDDNLSRRASSPPLWNEAMAAGRAAVIKALLQVLLKDEESAGIASWYQRIRVLIFVDNEAAKAALIRNYSPLLDAAHMLSDIAELDVELGCFPWYCRVPSKSNFSDAASRLSFGEYEECFRRIQPTLVVS